MIDNDSLSGKALEIEISDTTQDNRKAKPYKLTAFSLRNYKAFRGDTGWIMIKPLSLLVGNNSAGKSALYQVLRMLKFACERLVHESRFEDLSALEDLSGDFTDVCNKDTVGQEVLFRFRFSAVEEPSEDLTYQISLGKAPAGDYGIVKRVEIESDQKSWDLLDYYESTNLFFLTWKGKKKVPAEIGMMVQSVFDALFDFADSIRIVSAHRVVPARVMQLTGTRPKELGEDGSQSYNFLYALAEVEGQELDLVNNWLGRFGYTYFWKARGKNRGEFMLKNKRTGIESNIVDNGFGISQSLPIAVAVSSLRGEMLLMDTPEAFLQTNMQSEMGDLLVQGAQKGCLLVETGSEYLLLRIRRRVAEGKISADSMSIYFIEEDESGSAICREIGIDQEGEFIHRTPQFKRFFSSDFSDMEVIDQIRLEKYRAMYQEEKSPKNQT
ncbi:MAG: hypothetical protein LUH20_04600 [Lachnospiraceae bacterium]|nr:hypothetical protein [Lachnospiraceae bacterium]